MLDYIVRLKDMIKDCNYSLDSVGKRRKNYIDLVIWNCLQRKLLRGKVKEKNRLYVKIAVLSGWLEIRITKD